MELILSRLSFRWNWCQYNRFTWQPNNYFRVMTFCLQKVIIPDEFPLLSKDKNSHGYRVEYKSTFLWQNKGLYVPFWRLWQDSNLQSFDPKSNALSIKLQSLYNMFPMFLVFIWCTILLFKNFPLPFQNILGIIHINWNICHFSEAMASLSFTTFEIISLICHLVTVIILFIQFFKTHTGNCRGAIVSKTQTGEGQFIKYYQCMEKPQSCNLYQSCSL